MHIDLLEYRMNTKTRLRVKSRLDKIRKMIINSYKERDILERKIKGNKNKLSRREKFFKSRYESGKRKPTKTYEKEKSRLKALKNKIDSDEKKLKSLDDKTDKKKDTYEKRAKSAFKNHKISVRRI